jgi:hypothetical protein
MQRRMWVVLAVTLGAVLLGTTDRPAQAQDQNRATEIRIFVPFQLNGQLNPNLRIQTRETLMPPAGCQAGAITTTRPDAWRCVTADPCFVPQFAANQMTLACATNPWSGEVVLLTIETPLRTPEECMMPPFCRQPLNLNRQPWAMELANGARCVMGTGTIPSLGGMGLPYFCMDAQGQPGGNAAAPNRDVSPWTTFYLAPGSYEMVQVAVVTAWY